MTLEARLKDEARRLGFDLAGITTPEPPPHFETYARWVQAGLHGEMRYLEREDALRKRADPKEILPECESILVLGMRYNPPTQLQPPNGGKAGAGGRGRIASYAWGEDYHAVIPPKLRALVAFLEGEVGHPFPHRAYTDTGPLLERDLAQRAGLGWAGKNTCLIAPGVGSYFFLAEILLGLPLRPDPPFPTDHCGTCTRCIEACPTQAILPDRTLDARRCISYLTIESKGAIPPDLRPLMGDWVFGCDVCQTVCPWNIRFAKPAAEPAFAPRPGVPAPLLREELRLSPQEFNRKFKGSPVKRAKRRGYLRNVSVALGNVGALEDLPALRAALDDPESLVRTHARWALQRLDDG